MEKPLCGKASRQIQPAAIIRNQLIAQAMNHGNLVMARTSDMDLPRFDGQVV
jgi:hypothetical protein